MQVMFNAAGYKPLAWSDILTMGFAGDQALRPLALVNQQWIIAPKKFTAQATWQVIAQTGSKEIAVTSLRFIDNAFFNDCELSIAMLKEETAEWSVAITHVNYLQACCNISAAILSHIEIIVQYTYDHLSQRSSGKAMLTQHELIGVELANVYCRITLVKQLLRTFSTQPFLPICNTVFTVLQEITHKLAVLGGGRSVLRGNALELLFHLKVFQKVYLWEGN